jgi:peptidoglycan-associated lipoprotein
VRPAGFCDPDTACPGNQKCRDNRCGSECLDNGECGAGTFCSNGSCLTKPECGEGADKPACAEGSECTAGRCQVKIAQCGGDAVNFDFNRSNIRRNQRDKLKVIADCLMQPNTANMSIVGHCDERGTEEYNMVLGQSRADETSNYLKNLGVDGGKLSTNSMGEESPVNDGHNEKAWRANRRSEFKSN